MLPSSDLYRHTTFPAISGSHHSSSLAFITLTPSAKSDAYESVLWVIDITDERPTPTRLSHEGSVSSVCLSPDGKKIAFLGQRADQRRPMVYVIRVDGGEARPPHRSQLPR